MSLEADRQIDRRRLKRRLNIWRAVAIVALVAAAVALGRERAPLPVGEHVARLEVSGLIIDERERRELLAEVAEDADVRALIVDISSPGGTVVGGETLFKDLRLVAERKPVVAVMREVAASAGYMVAIGADRIFAQEGTLTGSIGVIFQTTDVSGLLEKLGVDTEALRSGPLKARPSPLEPLSPEVREATMKIIDDMFQMFVDMVADRRGLAREETLALADGRVFTGRQAMETGLVDEIGGERAARDWLETEHGIAESVPVRDLEVPDDRPLWRDVVTALAGKNLFSERVTLDGLISLWHPQLR